VCVAGKIAALAIANTKCRRSQPTNVIISQEIDHWHQVPSLTGSGEIVSGYLPLFHARRFTGVAESTGIRLAAVCE
jgi:hypothetical protein